MIKVKCTNCGYCLPCPNGVKIPYNFTIYNDLFMYKNERHSFGLYNLLNEKDRASNCNKCGECEKKCPQKIPIISSLKEIGKYFSKNR